jgi:hypothetical protein
MDLAVRILRHAILQVTGNIGLALRVSMPLFAVGILSVFLGLSPLDNLGSLGTSNAVGLVMLLVLLGVLASLLMAVRFHNEILQPDAGPFSIGDNLSRCLGYLGRSFLIGLLIGIPTSIFLMIFGTIFASSGLLSLILFLGVSIVASWVLYRLSPILPAGAIGKPIKLKAAWTATQPYSSAIFILVIALVVINQVVGLVLGVLPWPLGILSLAAEWFILLVGVSIYTTLYGVAIESRELT